ENGFCLRHRSCRARPSSVDDACGRCGHGPGVARGNMGGDGAKSSRGREAGHVQAHGKPDGTFQENIQSARGGAIVVAGKWKVSGESAILEGTFNGGRYIIDGTKKTLIVKKRGEKTL